MRMVTRLGEARVSKRTSSRVCTHLSSRTRFGTRVRRTVELAERAMSEHEPVPGPNKTRVRAYPFPKVTVQVN